MFATALVFAVLMGMFAKPKYYSILLIVSAICHCSGCILLANEVHPIAGFIFVGMAYGIGEPIAWTMVAYLAPERSLGLAFSFMSMSLEITLLILGILCGWFYDQYFSYDPTYYFLAAFGGIGLGATLWLNVYWIWWRPKEVVKKVESNNTSGAVSDVDYVELKEDNVDAGEVTFNNRPHAPSTAHVRSRITSMGMMMIHRQRPSVSHIVAEDSG
eukprot:TRINITY_DN336_c0_g1_i1.p1 TRINITY_DN336_c0_g1~~TRINITY_DN336_c0_g1_i1.p1  ORF type:complete len:215 (+),score=27.07 TRINITY_DN336_c0_g1_i1:2053-2697(+)